MTPTTDSNRFEHSNRVSAIIRNNGLTQIKNHQELEAYLKTMTNHDLRSIANILLEEVEKRCEPTGNFVRK